MNQLNLFCEGKKKQVLIENINPQECIVSRFNTRKTRSEDDIKKLADRIKRNGFELTRAPWAYKENGKYEIFAGSTRLQAAKLADVNIPLILHEGYDLEDISLLSDQDNENDEYHSEVPIVDIWAEYARLRDDEGWIQEKIGKVKGVSQKTVSLRLKLNILPEKIKDFIRQGFLTERHFEEITKLYAGVYFSPWLTPETAWAELAEDAAKYKKSVRDTIKKIDHYKSFIKCAEEIYNKFEDEVTLYDLSGKKPEPYKYNSKQEFVELLSIYGDNGARSIAAIKQCERDIRKEILDNCKKHKIWIDAKTEEEARKSIKSEQEKILIDKIFHNNYKDFLENIPDDSIDLIFTDPPYDEDHIQDYGILAEIASRKLKKNGSLIAYAGHYALPEILQSMGKYLKYWWLLAIDHGGANARLPGKWIYVEYKPLVWFVKDGRNNQNYVADLKKSTPVDKKNHEWEQSLTEAEYYIEQLTNKGDLIVDPFSGSGTTAIAALNLKRDYLICDIDKSSVEKSQERIITWLSEQENMQK